MINLISFLNSHFAWPIAAICLLLLALFIWKEWSQNRSFWFYLKIVVALLSLIALAMIALKPVTYTELKASPAVLLTEGYDEVRLDSLNKANKNLKLLSYSINKPIGSVLDSVSPLFVIGNGIQDFDFWQLEKVPVKFLGTPENLGITRLKYNQNSSVGEDLLVNAWYEKPPIGNRMILTDAGGAGLDSVDLVANTAIELTASLKVKGNYVYHIVEKDSLGNRINSEPLPIRVNDKVSLKVLLINSFPTFETKYLKNYLAEMGHEVIIRSQLTRGKYKFEYFNTERSPIYSFSQKNLANFDLLLIDANSYLSLSKTSLLALEDAVKNDALGLFVQPDPNSLNVLNKRKSLNLIKDNSSKTILEGFPGMTLEKYPYSFAKGENIEVIHSNNSNSITVYRRSENGRIGSTVLQNTYQMQLNGHVEAYQQLWSDIISAISKRKTTTTAWSGSQAFAFKDEPYSRKLRTSIEMPELIATGPKKIPLIQDPEMPNNWTLITYPSKTGWNQFRIKSDTLSSHAFYVMDTTKWKSLRNYNTILKNRRYFENPSENAMNRKMAASINQFWFFFVFLIGMGWLWLSPKLSSK